MSPHVVGLLPAAGKGRRVAGLGWRKELYPLGWEEVVVDGVPCRRPRVVATYQADSMVAAGVERLFVVVGENPELMHHLGEERGGVPIAYLYQREPRGGLFAIDAMRPFLPDEHLVLFGFPDTVIEPPDAQRYLVATHRAERNDLTLGIFETDRPSDFGMVDLVDERPVRIVDKPRDSGLRWMWGLACWGPAVTALQPGIIAGASIEREAVPGVLFEKALQCGLRVGAHRFEAGAFLDLGTPGGLNQAVAQFGDGVRKVGGSNS